MKMPVTSKFKLSRIMIPRGQKGLLWGFKYHKISREQLYFIRLNKLKAAIGNTIHVFDIEDNLESSYCAEFSS